MDFLENDETEPSSALSRTARMQHFIAGKLIRPTSIATGTQRNSIPRGWTGRLKPEDIADEDKRYQRSREELPRMKAHWASKSELLDELRNIPDSPESDMMRSRWQKDLQKEVDEAHERISRVETNPTPYTDRHVTLAALLGKKAVNWALSDDNRKMSGRVQDKDLGRTVDKDTGEPSIAVSLADVGEDKARHNSEIASLPRMERIKARVAPWHANVHEMSDGYGGPQEGGWWYDTGSLVGSTRGYMTRRGAEKAAEKLSKQFTKNKSGRNSLSISPSDAYASDYDQGVFDPVEYTDNMAEAMGMPSRFIQEPSDEDYDYSMFGQHSKDYRVNVTRGEMGDFPRIRPRYE